MCIRDSTIVNLAEPVISVVNSEGTIVPKRGLHLLHEGAVGDRVEVPTFTKFQSIVSRNSFFSLRAYEVEVLLTVEVDHHSTRLTDPS